MPAIRLIRAQDAADGHGPGNGMAALQKALRAAKLTWLRIGGQLNNGEIPWIWLYKDSPLAVQFAEWHWKFVLGPNVLFANSAQPGWGSHEQRLMDAESCAVQFTESAWYAELIKAHCKRNKAPVLLWSYPIEPQPEGPLSAEYDLLIYVKDRMLLREAFRAKNRCPQSTILIYGDYHRQELIEVARRSRCCLYLSTDDRGPLALAEIMLAGCPTVGIPHGAPWIVPGISGVIASDWSNLAEEEQQAMDLDRNQVRAWAVERFATEKTIQIIRQALEPISEGRRICGSEKF